MGITYIIGLLAAFGFIVYGIMAEAVSNITNFLDPGSVIITIGGTFAALIMSFPISALAQIPKHFKILLGGSKNNPLDYIGKITELAQEARRKGLLALEDKANEYNDEFLKSSIMLIVDAIEPEKVKKILDTELDFISDRHDYAISLYDKGAAFAPAFGMIGTLIGLINMLKKLDDVSQLTAGMGVALITTFYGSFLANVLFMPIATRLRTIHDDEMLCKTIIIEGIVSIQAGENPRHIEDKLLTMLSEGSRKKAKGAENKASSGDGDDKAKK